MIATTNTEFRLALKGKSILSFQLERWSDVWRNRHHIMTRLARENTVLFASPPFYVRNVLQGIQGRNSPHTGLSKITQSLYTYVPPRWLPFSYRDSKLTEAVRKLRIWHLKKHMGFVGMKEPILYVWYPSLVDMVGQFDESLVVYHCYDEYRSFTDLKESEREQLVEQEQRLLERADIVFAASEELCERKRLFNSNTHLVRNAVDYELFSQAQEEKTSVPEDMIAIPGPIIGCVSAQTVYMDWELLSGVFTLRPNWSFVFIGVERPEERTAEKELLAFQRLPNVYFIGRRRVADLPGYLKGCDVCVLPYVLNDVILVSSSPLKLYEYLAAGKPVICKPLPLISYLDTVIDFARDTSDWIAAIEYALQQDTPEKIEERQAIARQNTWDQRAAFISCKLAEELSRRRKQ